MYFILLISMAFLFGVVGVASNPSPCFGALSLVMAAAFGSAFVGDILDSFSALILILIYLGGMLVVFAYSVSMSSDMYPGVWIVNVVWMVIYCCSGILVVIIIIIGMVLPLFDGVAAFGVEGEGMGCVLDSGFSAVSLMYGEGGLSLLFVGCGLLLTLFVVLELVRGVSFGAYKG